MTTPERLATALIEAHAPAWMIKRARKGYYDDFLSEHALPLHKLVNDARGLGLYDIAGRAIRGEFDATKEESEAWARSEDGQQVLADLMQAPES